MVKTTQKIKKGIIAAAPKDLLENLGAGISIVDSKMRIHWVNKVLARWFGPLEKIKGKFCYQIYQHRNKVCPGCPTAKVFKTGRQHSAYQAGYNQKGERRYYHLIVTPIFNGKHNAPYAMELTYDITQEVENKKQKMAILKKMKDFCRNLIAINRELKKDVFALKKKSADTFVLNKKIAQKYQEIKTDYKLTRETLKDIQILDRKIITTEDLKTILDSVVGLAVRLTRADSAALRILNPDSNNLTIIASTGLSQNFVNSAIIRPDHVICKATIAHQKPVFIQDCSTDRRIPFPELIKEEGIKSCICLPISLKENPLGMLCLYFKRPKCISEHEMEMLSCFSDQVALVINEGRLYQEVHFNYFNTILSLSKAMEAKDPYTKGHSERVTQMAIKLAKELKFTETQIELLEYAGRVHDVGKIGISEVILNKPGRLTEAERGLIELHPQKGVEMLLPLKFLYPALPYILHHHERYDGRGYPHKLKKEEIPLGARILTCTDAFDAMVSNRPYRYRQLSPEEAINELQLNSGKQFDPLIVTTFIRILTTHLDIPVKTSKF